MNNYLALTQAAQKTHLAAYAAKKFKINKAIIGIIEIWYFSC